MLDCQIHIFYSPVYHFQQDELLLSAPANAKHCPKLWRKASYYLVLNLVFRVWIYAATFGTTNSSPNTRHQNHQFKHK